MANPDRELAAYDCQSLCTWTPTGDMLAGERLFRCSGCGSEWVVSQPWAPADADGSVAPGVAAEITAAATSGPSEGAAGSVDS